jgi:hypothetical protein
MTLERLQFWTDVTTICITTFCLIGYALTGNWQAVLGFGCAVIMSISALLSHRHTRHWWHKYCRAMGWEENEEGNGK